MSSTEGIQWPKTELGDRSTTETSKGVLAAAVKSVDPELSEAILKESAKKWRFSYNKYFLKHVESSLKSPQAAIDSANAGLKALYEKFDFVKEGKSIKFGEAVKAEVKNPFQTHVITGSGSRANYQVPYKKNVLTGDLLKDRLAKWVSYGTIERDAAEALRQVADHPDWTNLSDKWFVLLGAGSAMGPFPILMDLGANVVAVDLDLPRIWDRLITKAKSSAGKLYLPLKKPVAGDDMKALASEAGCNLLTQVPEILAWLKELLGDKEFTIGCYVYLDSEAHVRVALACDAIMSGLYESRKDRSGITLAYLCTPTDDHVIPEEAYKAAKKETRNPKYYAVAPLRPILKCFGARTLESNVTKPKTDEKGEQFYYVDGLVVAQGPNYALAKRLQHWRAIVARDAGCVVSSNVAPSTATASVVHNRQFAWAYDGMPFFKPYEIFQQDTSNAVMAGLLIHDVCNPASKASPKFPLRNPLELFSLNSMHGGVWRAAYKVGSIGEPSVIIHFVKVALPFLAILFVLAVLFFLRR